MTSLLGFLKPSSAPRIHPFTLSDSYIHRFPNLNSLNVRNRHFRDDKLIFNKALHQYMVNNTAYTSVTSQIAKAFPEFNAVECLQDIRSRDAEKLQRGVKLSKYAELSDSAVFQSWEDSRIHGHKMHELFELTILKDASFAKKELEKEYQEEHQMFLSFLADNSNLIPYRTEWRIFDEKLKIAGTVDVVFKDEQNKFYIFDWKRVNNLYFNLEKYNLQLNMYKYILEKNYDIKIDKMSLVVIHPDLSKGKYVKRYVPHQENIVEYMD